MDRSNHYELAFEAYLRRNRLCYVAVNEARRSRMGEEEVKSLDFLVYGPRGSRLVVDIKGRQYPGGTREKPRHVWECWAEDEDITGLESWSARCGLDYLGLLVFAYHLRFEYQLPRDTPDLFHWHEQAYLFRAVDVRDYRKHMRRRSPRWATVCLSKTDFRKLVRPLSHFLDQPARIPEECPL